MDLFSKKCTGCKTIKSMDDFPKSVSEASGLNSWCKECHKAHRNRKIAADPSWAEREKIRLREHYRGPKGKAQQLRYYFGLEFEEYQKVHAEQRGKCAICQADESQMTKRLAVDHNHTTGEFRGLLCEKCNRGIGMFNDSPELLAAAIRYLGETKPQPFTFVA